MADMTPQLPGTQIVQDPWEAAFGQYQQALVDLNGDGIPDGVMSPGGQVQPLNNRMRQSISRQAMAGREPSVDMGAIGRRAQASEQNSQAFEQGMGELVMGQPVRAGKAIGEAVQDPSIANVTNAGVQTGLAAFRPMAAAKAGIAGLGAAAVNDSGALNAMLSPAMAGRGDRDKARLEREKANTAKATAAAEAERLRAGTEAEKAAAELRMKEAADASAKAEYDASIRRADTAKDDILSKRPKRFDETSVGQVYDKLGVATPGVIAAGMGGLTRAGMAAMGSTNKMMGYAAPMAVGGVTGGVAASYPLGHELMFAPAANPEQQAYEAYARELPPTHPRKEEWTNYARSLPAANPARKAASDEFYDPVKMAERTGFGVAEGLLGGLAGSEMVGIAAQGARGSRNAISGKTGARTTVPGGGGQQGLPPAPVPPTPPVDYPQYKQLPTSVRTPVQEAYLAGRAIQGGDLPPKATAGAIKQNLIDQGIKVPVTANRVNTTNEAYNAFVAANGRPPTRSEFAQIFNSRTLSIPVAGVAGGSAMNAMLQNYRGE